MNREESLKRMIKGANRMLELAKSQNDEYMIEVQSKQLDRFIIQLYELQEKKYNLEQQKSLKRK